MIPTFSYVGDNQTVIINGQDTFTNDQDQSVTDTITTSNTNTIDNGFSSTIIPIILQGDGELVIHHLMQRIEFNNTKVS